MTCQKCSGPMVEQSTFGILSFICIFCGYAHYPAYPLRPAPTNICDVCGSEYNRRNLRLHNCPACRKLIGKNYNKLKHEMDTAYTSAGAHG